MTRNLTVYEFNLLNSKQKYLPSKYNQAKVCYSVLVRLKLCCKTLQTKLRKKNTAKQVNKHKGLKGYKIAHVTTNQISSTKFHTKNVFYNFFTCAFADEFLCA